MANQFEQCDLPSELAALSFTCPDCDHRFTRFIRGDHTLVSRCFGCDYALVKRTSERLLALVFGTTPHDVMT